MEPPEFLSWDLMVAWHRRSLEMGGGIDRVRDRAGLESALGAAGKVFFYAMIGVARREIAKAALTAILQKQFPR